MKEIVRKIMQYDTIIIHRHSNPDLDALGSQLGLKNAIKNTFKKKEVYAVGDMNERYSFVGPMDEVPDEKYKDALVIICDVAVSYMVSDLRYFDAKEVIVIDHHKNPCELSTPDRIFDKKVYVYTKPQYGACAEIITSMIEQNGWKLDPEGATLLYGGIITDTGRFQYGDHLEHSLLMGSYLVTQGANPQFIYNNLYVESLETRKLKTYFENRVEYTEHNVAYMFNDKDIFEKFKLDTFTVSRGMVNLMAGVEKVNIWANFTLDVSTNKVVCEFRSRDIVIVDVAKQFGGGGHEYACGCTLENFDEAKEVLKIFDKMLEDYYA